ncbi:4'-phosphopantetheinyl transferase superfamily protein [Streptomyces sp. NBC_00454]|uniref:4'-phosphopantetheinyl transferase superfamily protein n=1 Tax=Streptomyces sp. NBC_00454 TaxID=2975747 RepID=UPI0030E114B1
MASSTAEGSALSCQARPSWIPDDVAVAKSSDFVLGRAAVMACQALLHIGGMVVRDGRRPVFPPGLRGSISHSERRVGVCLGTVRQDVVAVGVDIERPVRLSMEGLHFIATPAEQAWIMASDSPIRMLTGLFSAKEAIYKSTSGLASRPPGFLDVELLPLGDREYRVNWLADLLPPDISMSAWVHCIEGYLVAYVLVKKGTELIAPQRAAPLSALDSLESSGESFVARKLIRADDPYLGGHYPGRPIYPGVFVLESVLQAAEAHLGKPLRMEEIPSIRLTGMLEPGNTLCIEAECTDQLGGLAVKASCANEDGVPVAALTVRFRPADSAVFDD